MEFSTPIGTRVSEMPDAWMRLSEAVAAIERGTAALAELREVRRRTLRELRADGFTRPEIAKRVGISQNIILEATRRD